MSRLCPRCGQRSAAVRKLCAYCGTRLTPSERPRHLNADQRRARASAQVERFIRGYGRKAQKGVEPNDRAIDRKVEARVQRMPAADLDRLMRDDE